MSVPVFPSLLLSSALDGLVVVDVFLRDGGVVDSAAVGRAPSSSLAAGRSRFGSVLGAVQPPALAAAAGPAGAFALGQFLGCKIETERERERAVNFEVGIITDRLLPLVTTIDSTLFFIVTSWYHNAGRWLKPIRKTSCSLLKGTVKVVERLKNNKRLSSSHTRCYYRSLLTAGLRLSAIKR